MQQNRVGCGQGGVGASHLEVRINTSLGDSVADVWFWTVGALKARRDGERSERGGRSERPCEPDDVMLCLDRIYKKGWIGAGHLRVLGKWGERRRAPSAGHSQEAGEARLWGEAMAHLGFVLHRKGIIG